MFVRHVLKQRHFDGLERHVARWGLSMGTPHILNSREVRSEHPSFVDAQKNAVVKGPWRGSACDDAWTVHFRNWCRSGVRRAAARRLPATYTSTRPAAVLCRASMTVRNAAVADAGDGRLYSRSLAPSSRWRRPVTPDRNAAARRTAAAGHPQGRSSVADDLFHRVRTLRRDSYSQPLLLTHADLVGSDRYPRFRQQTET